MTPQRWQKVKDLFAQASPLEPRALQLFLDGACQGDAELRAEVESLLAAHRTPEAVVDRAAAEYLPEAALDALADRWIGRRVGAYELIARIGRGGMGDVYRARRADAQFEKEVAIKLVRTGFDTRYVLERFRAERQILANLDHPNIARLLDGGATDDGLPYLVMELVDAEPIDQYCEKRGLSLTERLRLFREVCAAVSFAHQRLVVHRDLKPSNILVTPAGTIKLVDFGIAKILHERPSPATPDATVTAFSAMTPAFSSPEQILGLPVTTASDVYSLGVVLFHLLTGRSPYRRSLSSTRDAIQEVCETEPVKPSEAAALAAKTATPRSIPPRDLDDITLKTLRKEPDQRYASVEQLSEDIGRYLAGLPVHAHDGRFAYRAGKFMRRRKLELAAAILLIAALVTGTVISLHEAQIAKAESARAARNFTRVRQLANSLLFELHDSIKDLPGSTPARKILVTRALEYLDALAQENSGDDALGRELAVAYRRVGEIQGGIGTQSAGDVRAAVADYRKSVAMLDGIVARHPEDLVLKSELGYSLRSLATTENQSGDIRGAVLTARRALEVAKLVQSRDPGNATYRHELAGSYADSCLVRSSLGDYEGALADCRQAVPVEEGVLRQRDTPGERRDLAVMYARVASVIANEVGQTGKHRELMPESVALQRKALDMDMAVSRQYPGEDGPKRDVFTDLANLAVSLFYSGDVAGAIEECRAGATLVDELLGRDPQNVALKIDSALMRYYLATAHVAVGQAPEAEQFASAALAALDSMPAAQMTLQARNVHAASLLQLAKAHALLASSAKQASAVNLKEWRAAEPAFEQSASEFASLRQHNLLDADYANYPTEAAAGVESSKAAIARLAKSTQSASAR